MTAKHKKSKYDKARDKAFNYYFKKWRGNEEITPAFGQKVLVTRSGWDQSGCTVKNFRRTEVLLFSNDSFVRRLPLYADAIMGSGSSPSPQLV